MATIYVAGSYARREELFDRACDLVMAGHRVTSRWLKDNAGLPKEDQIEMDLLDLSNADVVLNFAEDGGSSDYHTGARHIELGYALALNDSGHERRLLLVGQPENLFHHHHDVEQYDTFAAALNALVEAPA